MTWIINIASIALILAGLVFFFGAVVGRRAWTKRTWQFGQFCSASSLITSSWALALSTTSGRYSAFCSSNPSVSTPFSSDTGKAASK